MKRCRLRSELINEVGDFILRVVLLKRCTNGYDRLDCKKLANKFLMGLFSFNCIDRTRWVVWTGTSGGFKNTLLRFIKNK
jgi:hypothetical protein